MPAITISGEPNEIMALFDLFTNRFWLQRQFDAVNLKLNAIQEGVKATMSEATDLKAKVERLVTETAQNTAFIAGLKDQIAVLTGLIEAGASDKELADAAREIAPKVDAAIAELDVNTPEAPAPAPEG